MAFEVKKGTAAASGFWTADKAVFVDASKAKVVPEGSKEAAFLLIPKGGTIPAAQAASLGLIKGSAPVEDKGDKPEANKGGKK